MCVQPRPTRRTRKMNTSSANSSTVASVRALAETDYLYTTTRQAIDSVAMMQEKETRLRAQKQQYLHGIFMHERVTFYEDEEMDDLQRYYRYSWYLFYALVVAYGLASFYFASAWSMDMRIVAGVLMVLYPMISNRVVAAAMWMWAQVSAWLPQNVYLRRDHARAPSRVAAAAGEATAAD